MNFNNEVPHTSPKQYTDLNGNVRSFTVVDHDRRTEVSSGKLNKPIEEVHKEMESHRENLIVKILALPASVCPLFFNCTIRGEVESITWNENLIRSLPDDKLRDIHTIITNKLELK